MALRVVPAGDERCDIHNNRTPATYICKDCARELGVQPGPTVGGRPVRRVRRALRRGPFRSARRALRRTGVSRHPRALIAGGAVLAIAAIVLIVVLSSGGGGDAASGPPTEAEVVQALDLSPDPSGIGWITLDGACSVVSIQIGTTPPTQPAPSTTVATNETGTVRAIVVESFSQGQAACVDRIRAALRDHF